MILDLRVPNSDTVDVKINRRGQLRFRVILNSSRRNLGTLSVKIKIITETPDLLK